MAQYEEQNPLDYRAGGDTIDDAIQKYMKEIARIYQFLNNLREHNSTGPNQVEPQPYMFKVTDNKLFIRNSSNNAWLYLFDITYRMGMSDNPDAVILTSDDVTTTAEALKLVKTNSDGDIDADITGNAYKFGNKTADQYVTVDDVSDAGAALKIVKTDSNGVAHVSISGSAAQLNGKAASYYLNEDDLATVPSGATVTTDANKLVKTNANGVLPVNITGNAAKIAGINNEINNLQDGQVLTYRVASNSWRNEDKGVVGSGKALAIYDGSTLLDEYSGDAPKSIDLANTAINSRIDLVNGIAGREVPVSVGDTAMLEGIPAGYFLECTTGGTTGATAPVITPPIFEGETINDGTAVWTVRKCLSASAADLGYTKQKFTSSGTFTAPLTGLYRITLVSGGGGGSGAGTTYHGVHHAGSGGGYSYVNVINTPLTAGETVSFVVGAGGTGGTAGNSSNNTGDNGGNGGTTSVTIGGTTYSATLGSGAYGSSGYFRAGAGASQGESGLTYFNDGGNGASAPYYNDGVPYGAGGKGGRIDNDTYYDGNAGGNGVVVIEWLDI